MTDSSISAQPPRIFALISGEDTDAGKSTIARHILRPALKAEYGTCTYILVESPRSREGLTFERASEGEDERVQPDDTPRVLTLCAKARARKQSAIVEVGGGQAAGFVARIEEFKGSEGRVDRWVLPVRSTQKEDKVIETIVRLLALGVPAERLVVAMNFVPADRTARQVLEREMPGLAAHAREYGYRVLSAGVPSSETIRKLRTLTHYSVGAIASSQSDYSADAELLWAQDTPEAEAKAAQLEEVALLAMGARGVAKYLDAVAAELLAA